MLAWAKGKTGCDKALNLLNSGVVLSVLAVSAAAIEAEQYRDPHQPLSLSPILVQQQGRQEDRVPVMLLTTSGLSALVAEITQVTCAGYDSDAPIAATLALRRNL